MIEIKQGTRIHGIRNELILAIMIAEGVFGQQHAELVITSGINGLHRPGSKHYTGDAIDLRSKTLNEPHRALKELKKRLGTDYDVLLEGHETPNAHFHIEWHPKASYVDN